MRIKPAEDDATLVEACIKKDSDAWARLVNKYSRLISSSIVNRLKKYGFDPLCEETKDIRQNIFASIWKDGLLEKIRNRKSIAHWLSIVSGNMAIAHMRKKMSGGNPKFVPISDDLGPEEAAMTEPPHIIDDEETAKKGLPERIESAISVLPPKEQLIIKLNLIHGMGYHEISDMLKIPKGTVSSYIKRARAKLKDALQDFFPPRV